MPLPDRTITEATARELMASMTNLNTSMARMDEKLSTAAEKFENQEKINSDVEARLRMREKDAGTLQNIVDWKRNLNGFFIAVGTALAIAAALALAYYAFGKAP